MRQEALFRRRASDPARAWIADEMARAAGRRSETLRARAERWVEARRRPD